MKNDHSQELGFKKSAQASKQIKFLSFLS